MTWIVKLISQQHQAASTVTVIVPSFVAASSATIGVPTTPYVNVASGAVPPTVHFASSVAVMGAYVAAPLNTIARAPNCVAVTAASAAYVIASSEWFVTVTVPVPFQTTGVSCTYSCSEGCHVAPVLSVNTGALNVISTAYRNEDSIGIFLANTKVDTINAKFILHAGRDYGINEGTVYQYINGEKVAIAQIKNGKAKIDITLLPQEVYMLEIE